MINIEIPQPDLVITKKKPGGEQGTTAISHLYGFTDFTKIPRDRGGMILFFDKKENLLFVGKARKLRQRVKSISTTKCLPLKITVNKCPKLHVCMLMILLSVKYTKPTLLIS